MPIKTAKIQGFTLVELAIIIIIIGLIIAGVSASTSLITQAGITSAIADLRTYQTSYELFLKQYNKFPGDMDTASAYWPTGCVTTVTPSDCNGGGDEIIGSNNNISAPHEFLLAWKHLSLAGLINDGIQPVDIGSPVNAIPGLNMPSSRFRENAGYEIMNSGWQGWNTSSDVIIVFGKKLPVDAEILIGSVLTTAEAFSIDQKIDDGTILANGQITGDGSGIVRMVPGLDVANCSYSTTFALESASCVLGYHLN